MFKRLRLIKWNPILFKVFGDAGYSWGGFDNVGKRVLEEVNREILVGFLAKEC